MTVQHQLEVYIELIVNFCVSSAKKSGARNRVQSPLGPTYLINGHFNKSNTLR